MAKSRGFGSFIVIVLVLAAAGGGGWYYWNKKSDKQPEFATTKVTRGEIKQAVTATGDLQSVTQVDVSSQVSGLVLEVMVDFNSPVKTGQVLARLDPATYESKLKAAKADLMSTEASNTLQRQNTDRIRNLAKTNNTTIQELEQAEAQLKQSDAQLATRISAVEDAETNLKRCTIYSPIDGIVLSRLTDKGRTVSASTSAPTLFTIVTDLTKMQIAAAVAEADIGSVQTDQDVTFTVDAYPGVNFNGKVTQKRLAAKVTSSVVSYDTIISVNNESQRLMPGMTANVSITVAQKTDVVRVANSALRFRPPAELLPKAPVVAAAPAGAKSSATMNPEERRLALTETFREAGHQQGTPVTPEILDKAKKLGKDKGLDDDAITQYANRQAGGGGRGPGGGGGGRRGGGGGGGQGGVDRGFTTAVTNRTVYRLVDPASPEKKLEAVVARLGISDGFFTEVIDGLTEGETLVTSVTMPGAPAPVLQQGAAGGAANPFQTGNRGGGGGIGGGGGARGGR